MVIYVRKEIKPDLPRGKLRNRAAAQVGRETDVGADVLRIGGTAAREDKHAFAMGTGISPRNTRIQALWPD